MGEAKVAKTIKDLNVEQLERELAELTDRREDARREVVFTKGRARGCHGDAQAILMALRGADSPFLIQRKTAFCDTAIEAVKKESRRLDDEVARLQQEVEMYEAQVEAARLRLVLAKHGILPSGRKEDE